LGKRAKTTTAATSPTSAGGVPLALPSLRVDILAPGCDLRELDLDGGSDDGEMWQRVCDDVFATGESVKAVRYVPKSFGPVSSDASHLSEEGFLALTTEERSQYSRFEQSMRRYTVHASAVRLTWETQVKGSLPPPTVWVNGRLAAPKPMGELQKLSAIAAQLFAHACQGALGAVSENKADGATASYLRGRLLRGGLKLDTDVEGDESAPPVSGDPSLPPPKVAKQKTMPTRSLSELACELSTSDSFLEQLRMGSDATSQAALLHEAMKRALDRQGKRVPAGAGAGARLERLVVCVLLYHHQLVDTALGVAHKLAQEPPPGGSAGIQSEPEKELMRIWQAARKVRVWVAERKNELIRLAEEASSPTDAGGDGLERGDDALDPAIQEERIVAPLEKRALFLLRGLRPATPKLAAVPPAIARSSTAAAALSRSSWSAPANQSTTEELLAVTDGAPPPPPPLPTRSRSKLDELLSANPALTAQQRERAVELASANEKRRKQLRKEQSFNASQHGLGTEVRARAPPHGHACVCAQAFPSRALFALRAACR
jgi:hypothetical protein